MCRHFNVRSPDDVIFADEWRQYPVTLVAENNATLWFCFRSPEHRAAAKRADLASRGPGEDDLRLSHMDLQKRSESAGRDSLLFKEKFSIWLPKRHLLGLKFTKLSRRRVLRTCWVPLLDALESKSGSGCRGLPRSHAAAANQRWFW